MPAMQPDEQDGETAHSIHTPHARSIQHGMAACLILILAVIVFRFGHDAIKMLLESDFVDFAHYYAYYHDRSPWIGSF